MDFSRAVTSTPYKMDPERSEQLVLELCKSYDYQIIEKPLLPIGAERKLFSNIKNDKQPQINEELSSISRSSSTLSIEFKQRSERLVSELCDNDDYQIPQNAILPVTTRIKFLSNLNDEEKPKCRSNTTSKSKEKQSTKPIKITLAREVHSRILKIASEACLDAEKIAIINKSNFCFNGIEHLCSKTKENIKRQESAVTKLQSHGVPWVIKTFVLSSARISDSWKSLHKLLAEKHQCLQAIEDEHYNPNLRQSFQEWQSITKDMLSNVYETFKMLDIGSQEEQRKYTQNFTYFKKEENEGLQIDNVDKN